MEHNLQQIRKTWNLRARDFFAKSQTPERQAQMDTFWQRVQAWDLVAPGDTAIDVGCGTGDYLLRLADEGIRGVGTDIAEEMLACAKEQDRHGLTWVVTPWCAEAVREHGWEGQFSFAYAVFSPAMDDGGLTLLDRVSTKSGLVITFRKREESLFSEVEQALRAPEAIAKDSRWQSTVDRLEAELREIGRTPRLEIFPETYVQEMSIADHASYIAKRLSLYGEESFESLHQRALRYLCETAGTSDVTQRLPSTHVHEIAWLYWKKS